MGVKKTFVVQLQHREVNARRDKLDLRGQFIPGLVRQNLNLARIGNHVRVGEDAFAFDDHAGAGRFGGRLLRPRPIRIGKRMVENIFTTELRLRQRRRHRGRAVGGLAATLNPGLKKTTRP